MWSTLSSFLLILFGSAAPTSPCHGKAPLFILENLSGIWHSLHVILIFWNWENECRKPYWETAFLAFDPCQFMGWLPRMGCGLSQLLFSVHLRQTRRVSIDVCEAVKPWWELVLIYCSVTTYRMGGEEKGFEGCWLSTDLLREVAMSRPWIYHWW